LLFNYVAAFMYEGDTPLAEKRAAALSLDSTLLAVLLGRAELRELLDPEVIAQTERELQRLEPDRHAHDAEGVVDLLRMLGPLTLDEILARVSFPEGSERAASGVAGAADSDTSAAGGEQGHSSGSRRAEEVAGWLEGLRRANRVLGVTI